jgi:hypothetical protein
LTRRDLLKGTAGVAALAAAPAATAAAAADTAAQARRLLAEWEEATARAQEAHDATNAVIDAAGSYEEIRAAEERANDVQVVQLEIEERLCRLGLAALGRSARDLRGGEDVAVIVADHIFVVSSSADMSRRGKFYSDVIPPVDVVTLA